MKMRKIVKRDLENVEIGENTKSGDSSEDTASNSDSTNVSVGDSKMMMEPSKKYTNREKKKGKVEKNKSNTLLALIDDSSSDSDPDEEIKRTNNVNKKVIITSDEEEKDNTVENFVSLKKCKNTTDNHRSEYRKNRKKRSKDNSESSQDINVSDDSVENKPEIFKQNKKRKVTHRAIIDDSENSSGSDVDDKDIAMKDQEKENRFSAKKKFDLEAEARDLEEMISAQEEEARVPQETVRKLKQLEIKMIHTPLPQHQIETCAGSRGPTAKQRKLIEKFGPIKYGKYTPEEDDIIVGNWKSFCKMHEWDPRDVKPFLYMRHREEGYVLKFEKRQKFVQFLANGLPWRTLYSVYWRFRNLYQPHIQTKYTKDEDKLIIAYMENSSAINEKNVRKFSDLAKILNRTRASVWRRYRLLKKKRHPSKGVKWDLHIVRKLMKNLLKFTLSDKVCQLKDLDIPHVVWKKISDKFKIDSKELKQFWLMKLHMLLFCTEPVYLNDIKIKLIEYFYATGISESWEIQWPNVAKHFDGMTSQFLADIFHSLTHDEKLQDMEFKEILEYLYEVKKPQLQDARTDKCLPRIVWKKGNVKVLDVTSITSKRKTVNTNTLDFNF